MVDTERPYDCEQHGKKAQKKKRQKQSQRREERRQLSLFFCCDCATKKEERKYSASVVTQQKYELCKADKCTEQVDLTFWKILTYVDTRKSDICE